MQLIQSSNRCMRLTALLLCTRDHNCTEVYLYNVHKACVRILDLVRQSFFRCHCMYDQVWLWSQNFLSSKCVATKCVSDSPGKLHVSMLCVGNLLIWAKSPDSHNHKGHESHTCTYYMYMKCMFASCISCTCRPGQKTHPHNAHIQELLISQSDS